MSGSLTRGERLQRALVSAFPSAERLDELVALHLDENPAVVAAGPDLSARIFSLTEWAAKRGRVGDLIGAALDANPNNPELQSLARDPAFRADWRDDIASPDVDGATAIAHLRAVPPGPLVPADALPVALVRAFAREADSRHLAANVIRQAGALRRAADPDRLPTVIDTADLPGFDAVGPASFWTDVFVEARKHGPRMLAALLLSLPEALLDPEARRHRSALLESLTSGRVYDSSRL